MAVIDFDGNGWQDLLFVNGSRLPVDPADTRHTSHLFRNFGEGGFEDVTVPAGVALVAYGQGATAGDFDNDGFEDLLITAFGRMVLYHNNGDGTFNDATVEADVSSGLWSTSAAFADLDGDGSLDLYVCTYGDVPLENPLVCERAGRRTHCLPTRYAAQPDLLFRNLGDGRFEESASSAGIHDANGRGLGLAIADFTGDDRPDIFVANDTSANYLFVNRGGFEFDEQALKLGTALTGEGATMSGMGVACADFDRNGRPDLFVTNFFGERSVLYQNNGRGGFIDRADAAGLGAPSRDRLGFGTVFLDADLDGHPDLFVANGHVSDMSHEGIAYKMRPQFFHSRGDGTFRDVSDSVGPYFLRRLLGRGVAVADINSDGLPDVVVSHILDPAAVLLNRTREHGHWCGVELIGTQSNRDARNANVVITVAGEPRQFELVAGGGYLSSSDKRLLVGLGATEQVDELEVRWPSGAKTRVESPQVDRYIRVREAPARRRPTR